VSAARRARACREVAGHGFKGVYVDANAVSPATVRNIGRVVEAAEATSSTAASWSSAGSRSELAHLSLGRSARDVAAVFAGSNLEAIPLDSTAGAASAVKACYAAWTKGATALLAAIRALATHEGVEAALLEEWKRSQPELPKRSEVVTVQARKAWRWIGEMEEIAASFEAAGLLEAFIWPPPTSIAGSKASRTAPRRQARRGDCGFRARRAAAESRLGRAPQKQRARRRKCGTGALQVRHGRDQARRGETAALAETQLTKRLISASIVR